MEHNNTRALSRQGVGIIGGLIVQYLLGILANLYVEFPETNSFEAHWRFARGQWLLLLHMLVGTLIVVGLIVLYIQAIRLKNKTWQIVGGIAMGSAILAWVCGEEFVSHQQDFFSFAMALFFLISFISLGWGLYKSNK